MLQRQEINLLSDLSGSDFHSHNDEVLCTTEKQSDGNCEKDE